MTTTRKGKRFSYTPEQRQAKVDAALGTLKSGVEALIASDDWQAYLTFQARFHRYSFGNTLLILMQCPGATMVGGMKSVWNPIGRRITKGSTSITILRPNKVTVEDKATGETRSIITGWGTAAVFDVSQTEGATLPARPGAKLAGEGDALVLAGLVAQVEALGFTYDIGDTGSESTNGYCDYAARRIMVRGDLAGAQAVKTTAHELAHALLHDPADPDNKDLTRGLREVEAESVAFVVLHALDIDASDYSLGYVAGWSGGNAEAVQRVGQRVQRTAKRILAGLGGAE